MRNITIVVTNSSAISGNPTIVGLWFSTPKNTQWLVPSQPIFDHRQLENLLHMIHFWCMVVIIIHHKDHCLYKSYIVCNFPGMFHFIWYFNLITLGGIRDLTICIGDHIGLGKKMLRLSFFYYFLNIKEHSKLLFLESFQGGRKQHRLQPIVLFCIPSRCRHSFLALIGGYN